MYVLKMNYSWGGKEPKQKFKSFKQAWKKAQTLAMSETEVVSTEHECEVGMFVEKNEIKEEGKISLHYLYDDEYCYYSVKHVPEYTDGAKETVFTTPKELYEHLRFWCNGCGELHYHGEHDIKEEELPELMKYAYFNLWSEGSGCLEYILEYDGEYYLAIEGEYDDAEYETIVEKLKEPLFSNKYCRVVIGKNCHPFDRHEVYFLIPANTKKETFEKLEKTVVSALCSE